MKRQKTSTRLAALVLALALLTGCGPAAASMFLRRTEGTVGVADEKGKTVELRDELGLYSGYGVDTEAESYAWIDLDSVKLAKLDENSDISIEKSGKKLEIVINRGSVYFDVTEPLADDETMEIRASDLLVGIRGTCGWVDAEQARVGLLRGKVACGETEVSAGELAERGEDGALSVREMTLEDVPDFVREEVDEKDLPAPGRVEKRLIRQTYYNGPPDEPGNLSNRLEYIYDENGALTREELYEFPAGTLVYCNEYIRDENGNPVVTRSYDADGVLTGYTENICDENGRPLETYQYDADGTLTSHWMKEENGARKICYDDPDNPWVSVETWHYDDQGRLIRSDILDGHLDGNGQTSMYTTYEYNEDGSERRAESHAVEESGEERIQRVEVELLDENGNVMQNTIFYPDHGGNRELRVSSITSYTYDEDGYNLGYTYCEYYPDGPITGSMVAEYERVN